MARRAAAWLERRALFARTVTHQGALLRTSRPSPAATRAAADPRRAGDRRRGRYNCSTRPTPAGGRSACSASACTTCARSDRPTVADPPQLGCRSMAEDTRIGISDGDAERHARRNSQEDPAGQHPRPDFAGTSSSPTSTIPTARSTSPASAPRPSSNNLEPGDRIQVEYLVGVAEVESESNRKRSARV